MRSSGEDGERRHEEGHQRDPRHPPVRHQRRRQGGPRAAAPSPVHHPIGKCPSLFSVPLVRALETLTLILGPLSVGLDSPRPPAQEAKFWADKKKFWSEAIYGSAFNIRKDLDSQILSRCFAYPFAVLTETKKICFHQFV